MASTKYDIASSALLLIGANPVTSFANDDAASAEEQACYHLYQSTLDQWLSAYDWRFAMKEIQLSLNVAAPVSGQWQYTYNVPSGFKRMRNVVLISGGKGIEYDRFENMVYCNYGSANPIAGQFTYEPSVPYWPGYFVTLMETALASRLSISLAGKIDMKKDFKDDLELYFRIAKSADSQQQTSRKFNQTGRGSIMEARRR